MVDAWMRAGGEVLLSSEKDSKPSLSGNRNCNAARLFFSLHSTFFLRRAALRSLTNTLAARLMERWFHSTATAVAM